VKYLVTAYYWLVFGLTSPLVFLAGLGVALVSAVTDPLRRAVHAYICRVTSWYLRVWPGWAVEVTGRENIPPGACVLVANHQSMADVVACMGLYAQFKFVSKASLFSLPLVGWMMRLARYVSLERGRPRSMQQMMERCLEFLKQGMPVLLFPEGTYSQGGAMLPFKRGAFLLAVQARVPVVPVLLSGTTGLIEGDGPWMSPRCRIRVQVLEPVPPGDDAEALRARVRSVYEERLGHVHADRRAPPLP
jgi:1-acyl-sn-glycerol-3-phosphate acyltransferase